MEKEKESRTANSARNAVWSMAAYAITLLFNFVNRTVFIHFLSVDYLGVNGLFSNILTILSFAELGIGNAIVYNMYKPLAEKDTEKLKSLMKLYRVSYTVIGVVVTVIGLCVIPFLGLIIREQPDISENLVLIYVLFLLNTSTSYFFMYKRSIIVADQKLYVAVFYQQMFDIIRVVLQLIFLILTHNYIVYLLTFIFCTLANNIALAAKADKMYPFLKEKNVKPIEEAEKKSIFKDVRALFMYRIGSVVLDGTDNIIITNIVGLSMTGLCSNYTMLIAIFSGVLAQFLNSFTASVGNLNATSKDERSQTVFDTMFFACVWMYGFAAGGIFTFINDFVSLWIGEKFFIPYFAVLALVMNFYFAGIQFVPYTFRTTMGYFRQGKWAPVCAAVINIVLSIWWGRMWGVAGIFFATLASRGLTINLIDPILVYKLGFRKNPVRYFFRFFVTLGIVAAFTLVSGKIVSYVPLDGWLGLVIKCVVYSVAFNGLMLIFFSRSKEFRELYAKLAERLNLPKIGVTK